MFKSFKCLFDKVPLLTTFDIQRNEKIHDNYPRADVLVTLTS
jgi:hypothetical protein